MELFLSSLIMLAVLVDPLGHAAIFAGLTDGRPRAEVRKIALASSLIAFCVLLAFGLIGGEALAAIGVTIDAFRISGGLLLFVIAFRILMGRHDPERIVAKSSAYAEAAADITVFPLAIPLLAGPGAMTAMILLTAKAGNWMEGLWVDAALLLVMASALFCMEMVECIKRLLGPGGFQILTRLIGVLIAAIAVQFIVDGLRGLGFGG